MGTTEYILLLRRPLNEGMLYGSADGDGVPCDQTLRFVLCNYHVVMHGEDTRSTIEVRPTVFNGSEEAKDKQRAEVRLLSRKQATSKAKGHARR